MGKNNKILAREIPVEELRMKFRRYCCASICPNTLNLMQPKWLKQIIAKSVYYNIMKMDEQFNEDKKRITIIKAAIESGLSQTSVENYVYKNQIPTLLGRNQP